MSWQNSHLMGPTATWKLLGPSEAINGHTAKCMTCSHQSLLFPVPVGMKDGFATVPNRIGRCEATSWQNCHLIFPGATWKLLGPSGGINGHTAKCMTCSCQSLFFPVPVGMKDVVATVPNRIGRCEAVSWPNCPIFVPAATWKLLHCT